MAVNTLASMGVGGATVVAGATARLLEDGSARNLENGTARTLEG